MKKTLLILGITAIAVVATAVLFFSSQTEAAIADSADSSETIAQGRSLTPVQGFEVEIMVDGRPLPEYAARGRRYVEAVEGSEYDIRVRNPYPFRVAVALSVDGLNSIDARRTTAWNASKWVIAPYGSIHVSGWQMSSERARRFYFTTERDSYAAKLGQAANLGAISAVFFRERHPVPVPIVPARPRYEEDGGRDNRTEKSRRPPAAGESQAAGREQRQTAPMQTDDEYAATGIGRSVRNDVRFVDMELESRPAGEVNIRYEYYPALVRLGILPHQYPRVDSLRRRESATGFEDRRFSPEP
ncbi:MAG: hypothetical protein ACR2LM_18335 [Pyrinomonadaceae bacterium]